MINSFLRTLFTLCIVWPVIWLWLGLRIRHRERLPTRGPAIIVANHNSHMDVFALISRKGGETNPLAQCEQALRDGKILILFPEGTRGEPGKLSPLKSGLWHLSQRVPEVPIIPIWLRGTESVMAKGNRIPLPLFIDVNIGSRLYFHGDKHLFMDGLRQQLLLLAQQTKGMHSHE